MFLVFGKFYFICVVLGPEFPNDPLTRQWRARQTLSRTRYATTASVIWG